jgi:hypothetical protein
MQFAKLRTAIQLENRGALATGFRRATINQRQNQVFLPLEWYQRTRSLPLLGSVIVWQRLSHAKLQQYREHKSIVQETAQATTI